MKQIHALLMIVYERKTNDQTLKIRNDVVIDSFVVKLYSYSRKTSLFYTFVPVSVCVLVPSLLF